MGIIIISVTVDLHFYRFSVNDIVVLLTMSITGSTLLFLTLFGYEDIFENYSKTELWNLLVSFVIMIGFICILMYIFVKTAAHFFLYVAFGALFAIFLPSYKARDKLQRFFKKAK